MKSYAALLLVGLSAIVYVEAIKGGADAPEGKFPYQVLVRDQNEFLCGASIIHKKFLLTSAACVYKVFKPLELVVGTNKFNGDGGDSYYPKAIHVHPEHRRTREGYSINDLAIIELSQEIVFNSKVQPVKLPATGGAPLANTHVVVSGFGQTSYGGSFPDALKFINNEILDFMTCTKKWLSTKFIILEKGGHICTKAMPGAGACGGDYGTPLVNDDGVQVGIASFGYRCAYGVPDVYTNVAYYVDWINKFIADK